MPMPPEDVGVTRESGAGCDALHVADVLAGELSGERVHRAAPLAMRLVESS